MNLEDVKSGTMFYDPAGDLYLKVRRCMYVMSVLEEWREGKEHEHSVCMLVEHSDKEPADFEIYIHKNNMEIVPYEGTP